MKIERSPVRTRLRPTATLEIPDSGWLTAVLKVRPCHTKSIVWDI